MGLFSFQTEEAQSAIKRIVTDANDETRRMRMLCSEVSWRRCHIRDIASYIATTYNRRVDHIRVGGTLKEHSVDSQHRRENRLGQSLGVKP